MRLLRAARRLAPLSVGFVPAPAAAWGPVGHEVVAYIAEDNLTEVAKHKVAAILGGDLSLADVANWADQIRQTRRPDTAPWHFIDMDARASLTRADEARYCSAGSCVVDQINANTALLKSDSANPYQRREALKFLIHFVGDVHQPLHCADDRDRGGNEKFVRFVRPGGRYKLGGRQAKGTKIRLHALWDHLLELRNTEDSRELASELEQALSAERKAAWARGTPADWAWESYTIAHDTIYSQFPPGPTDRDGVALPSEYYAAKMREIVNSQLEKAGIRLARSLNEIFAH